MKTTEFMDGESVIHLVPGQTIVNVVKRVLRSLTGERTTMEHEN